jgi:hypothetical protein
MSPSIAKMYARGRVWRFGRGTKVPSDPVVGLCYDRLIDGQYFRLVVGRLVLYFAQWREEKPNPLALPCLDVPDPD